MNCVCVCVCVEVFMCGQCVCARARQLVHCCLCVECSLGDVGCEVGVCFICLPAWF